MSEVVVVVGAAGGVGATTLAALLARRLAGRRTGVVLVDLDPSRGGVEVLLGIEAAPGLRWPDLRQVHGALAPGDLDGVLPRWRGVEVLSATRSGTLPDHALKAVWDSLRAARRVVVVDLPSRALLGAGSSRVLQGRPAVLLTTGQDVVGVAGALAAVAALGDVTAGLVLRRRRRARVAPFEVARLLDLPLVGLLPDDRRLAEAVDRGFGPAVAGWSPLARAVGRIAEDVGGG